VKKGLQVLSLAALAAAAAAGQERPDAEVTFRSDVSLVRVDVQVLDRNNRFVPGLTAADFVLREEGRVIPIRNFGREEMPLDVLFLFDVSRSMRPHVEAVAQAAKDALNVLGDDDRVAIMVFDRSTRLHSGFRNRRDGVNRELARMLDAEDFNGGTDIAKGILAAADHVQRNARKDARRAIVIVTDDQTERSPLDEHVLGSLTRADAVLSLLLAPDAMGQITRRDPGGRGRSTSWPPVNLPWPGGGRGPVINIPGVPGGGAGGSGRFGTQPAGTPEMAERSGGDTFPVDDAASLERTLERLRQRYALYFNLPAGARAGEERGVEVTLASRSKPGLASADLKYRRSYVPTANAPLDAGTVVATGEAQGVKKGGWRRAEPGEK
jgi:VWFA-related protein